MGGWFARVLYAKAVNRKRKSWQDGFISIDNLGQSSSARLYDETGVVISAGRVPASEHVTSGSEGL